MITALSFRLPAWLTFRSFGQPRTERSVSEKILQANHINRFPDEHLRRLFLYKLQGSNAARIFIAAPKKIGSGNNSLVANDLNELKSFLAQKNRPGHTPQFDIVAHADVVLTTSGPQIFPAFITNGKARKLRYFRDIPADQLETKVYGKISEILLRAVQDRVKNDPQHHLAKSKLPPRTAEIPKELGDIGVIP